MAVTVAPACASRHAASTVPDRELCRAARGRVNSENRKRSNRRADESPQSSTTTSPDAVATATQKPPARGLSRKQTAALRSRPPREGDSCVLGAPSCALEAGRLSWRGVTMLLSLSRPSADEPRARERLNR